MYRPRASDNDAFPFATSQEIDLGYATVRATRLTYVGELGWELYIPVEFAVGCLRAARRSRARPGTGQCRLLRDRFAAAGKGLPRLGPRADAGHQPVRSRAGIRSQARQRRDFRGKRALQALKDVGGSAAVARRVVSLVDRCAAYEPVGRRTDPAKRRCRPASSLRPPSDTRSASRSRSASSATPTDPPTPRGSTPAATRSTSPANASMRRFR